MFVKKFEADTLEEALKAVKFELGPDAIILKTITNNGLKGAFKKKRIEITAAISDRSFEKKAKVDKVLNDEQKEAFYQKPAATIKESIHKYNTSPGQSQDSSYGALGLNKVVNTISKGTASLADVTSKTSSLLKNSLDDFLTSEEESQGSSDSEDFEMPAPRAQKQAPQNRGKYAEPPQVKAAKVEVKRAHMEEDRRELSSAQLYSQQNQPVQSNTVSRS